MKLIALTATLFALLALPVLAADAIKNDALKVQLEAPADFTMAEPATVELPEALGAIKVVFNDKEAEKSGGQLLIHQMALPEGADYAAFKTSLPERVNEFLNGKAKVVRHEDVEIAKFKGFIFEFEAPGDGKLPSPDGTIPHHVRWYLFQDGDSKLIGLVYHGREAAWKALDPRFATSMKTLKKVD